MIRFADEPTPGAPETVEPPPEAAPRRPAPNRGPVKAVIKVIGVGGGGGNSVNRMIEAGVSGVEFLVANTDAQALELSQAPVKLQIGVETTGGLGCGGDPEVGRQSAREDMDKLLDALEGADMVFVTLGAGGGTGTGAGPVVACAARELGALCVAVVTRPLTLEGRRRIEAADEGLRELREYVDTLICVPNDRVSEVYGDLRVLEAFRAADDVLRQAVQGISDPIQTAGLINIDFADVRSALKARGDAVMGIGVASGEDRVRKATEAAISSPLLEDTSIQGASSILINVSGGESMSLTEMTKAMEIVRDAVESENASDQASDNILLGVSVDSELDEGDDGGRIKVTVVATGFPDRSRAAATPQKIGVWGTPPTTAQDESPRRREAPPAEEPAARIEEADDGWGDLATPPLLRKTRF